MAKASLLDRAKANLKRSGPLPWHLKLDEKQQQELYENIKANGPVNNPQVPWAALQRAVEEEFKIKLHKDAVATLAEQRAKECR